LDKDKETTKKPQLIQQYQTEVKIGLEAERGES
jgi:hypothetical protein